MHFGRYRPEHESDLYTLYCRATASVPHCRFVPSQGGFGRALAESVRVGMDLFVAEDAGRALAFAGLSILLADDEAPTRIAITALFAHDEDVGQELLRVCLDHARATGFPIRAFPDAHNRCPIPAYNAGWCGLSDRQPMVARQLTRAGFTPFHRELHLSLADIRSVAPPVSPPEGVTLRMGSSRGDHYERQWQALRDGVQVGVCYTSSVAHLTDDPAAVRWGYVQGLGVEEAHRQKGIARWLMTTALADMAKEDFEECWLTTGAANWPAQRLYLSLGFEVVDASTCFRLDR